MKNDVKSGSTRPSMKRGARLAQLSLATLCAVATVLFIRGETILAGTLLFGASMPALYILIVYMKSPKAKLDMRLVMSIIHMYAVSLGEAGPDELIGVVVRSPEYGFYSKIFNSVRRLAKDFGYGFSKAILYVSKTVKPPLKDILIRFSEIFSSARPREFLELELSTIMEEYSGLYSRMIESMKLLGGMFSTFQSVSIFVVLTVAILMIFITDERVVTAAYLIAIASVIIMFLAFRMISMKEPLVYVGENPSRPYRLFRLAFFIALALMPISVAAAFLLGIPYGLMAAGAAVLLPGALAYKLEAHVTSLDENYPTFLKALGENLASTSDLRSALNYVLYMELGPLKELALRASARLGVGVSGEATFTLLASEASSYKIHMFNKIFLDAFKSGSNTVEVGKTLGNSLIRFLEFRKRRMAVAKSFEGVVMILQPITVALLIILGNLCRVFASMFVSLPYFEFGTVPLNIINTGNVVFILLITILNSLAIMEARGGFWGSSLLYAGLLFLVSGGVWIGAEYLVEQMFGQLQAPLFT
ncbi:MAG: hypothetical protein H5T34_01690 [Candidatus Methanomethyliales bacterium]|nr:hypothetical protein [Candidatus Methanomethylicales archaeon]